jgi:hypothetical protein
MGRWYQFGTADAYQVGTGNAIGWALAGRINQLSLGNADAFTKA